MRVRPPWWSAAIGILALAGLCSAYHLRVVNTSGGQGLGLGSGPGRPAVPTYMALSGDLIVEIRQLPVWARGRRLVLLLLEHNANGAAADNASTAQGYSVQGSIQVNVDTNAASTSANTGGRLQWVRGYNRSGTSTTRPLGKMTSSQPNRASSAAAPGGPAAPTTLKPLVARFPCGFVSRGGRYALRLAGLDRTKKTTRKEGSGEAGGSSSENESGERAPSSNRLPGTTTTTASTAASPAAGNATARPAFNDPALPATNETGGLFLLDVLWPRARLSLGPKEIVTYPEEAVRATVEFLGVRCPSAKGSPVSESWLELVYCGPVLSDCTYSNYTQRQILHSEQVLGYPHQLVLGLQCELFGMAGYYSLHLRAGRPSVVAWPVDAGANATIKAVWSDRFVFNVHARSIFPCAAHSGVSALFTYPGCVLPAGDRVRLFARLRADVSTLMPPLTLQYVAEQRVAKGSHAVAFDCDLFSERYVEYCFVYVSQAITGAVTDVRMDCVPTLPVSDADSGSWGAWSPWSACTSTCGGGTRNRYRFCDSPPPRYGAKFCEGSSLETQRCGPENEWDCAPEGASADLPPPNALPPNGLPPGGAPHGAGGPSGGPAVGSGCRCGCVVHLGTTKPATLLASSSKSCPGRSFWLVQADANHVVRLWVQQQRLSCGAQWLRVRDGDSLAGRLLLSLDSDSTPSSGAPVGLLHHHAVATEAVSSSNTMLVEFYSDEAVAALEECAAGFLAHAQQAVPPNETLVGYPLAVAGAGVGAGLLDGAGWWSYGGALRLTVVHAAAVAFLGGVVLLSACLCAQYGHRYRKYQLTAAKEDHETLSLTENEETGVLVRAASSATLVSEVVSLKGFKITQEPEGVATEESVLAGSADSVSGSVTVSVGSPESAGLSTDSGRGLGPPLDATASLPNSPQPQTSPQASMRRSGSCERSDGAAQRWQRPSSVRIGPARPAPRPCGGPVSPVREEDQSGASNASACGPQPQGGPQGGAELAGRGGPAKWRPMPRRLARGVSSNASSTSTLVNEVPGSPASSARSWSRASCASTSTPSSSRTATPTNARSPPPGMAAVPGLGGVGQGGVGLHRPLPLNPKESKDRRNRERLLRAAGSTGGSDFSLGPDTEMEMDYYDYNVHNACAAPGSLLGMDPAYLMWIPPYTPGSAGSWEEDGEDGPLFDGDVSSEASDHVHLQQLGGATAADLEEGTELQELRSPHAPPTSSPPTSSPPATSPPATSPPAKPPRTHFVQGTHQSEQRALIHTARVTELTVKETEAKAAPLALQQLTASPRRLAGRQGWQQHAGDTEKETAVVKSPSDLLYRLHQDLRDAEDDDEIKFADDADDDDCEDIFSKDSKVDPKTVPLLGKRSDLNV